MRNCIIRIFYRIYIFNRCLLLFKFFREFFYNYLGFVVLLKRNIKLYSSKVLNSFFLIFMFKIIFFMGILDYGMFSIFNLMSIINKNVIVI